MGSMDHKRLENMEHLIPSAIRHKKHKVKLVREDLGWGWKYVLTNDQGYRGYLRVRKPHDREGVPQPTAKLEDLFDNYYYEYSLGSVIIGKKKYIKKKDRKC